MNKALTFTTKEPNDWATPEGFFEMLSKEFGPFDLDVCAYPHNAKCEEYFTPDVDGLAQEWHGAVWCNPSYGHGNIVKWLSKAEQEIRSGRCDRAMFLVPAATDTAWFHEYCVAHAERILFVRNRLHFSNPERTGRGSHPSMVVWFTQPSLDRGVPLRWDTILASESTRRGTKHGERRGIVQGSLF